MEQLANCIQNFCMLFCITYEKEFHLSFCKFRRAIENCFYIEPVKNWDSLLIAFKISAPSANSYMKKNIIKISVNSEERWRIVST